MSVIYTYKSSSITLIPPLSSHTGAATLTADDIIAICLESTSCAVAACIGCVALHQTYRMILKSKQESQALYVIGMSLLHGTLLCIFEAIQTVTVIATQNTDYYIKLWPVTMFFYIATTFCSFALSMNRLVAAFSPLSYTHWFPPSKFRWRLLSVWPAALAAEIPFLFHGCGNGYDTATFRRAFMRNGCGDAMVCYSMAFSLVELAATIANVFTILKLRRATKAVLPFIRARALEKRRRQQLRFITQALAFSVAAFLIAIGINFIAPLWTNKWWMFTTSNIVIPLCCSGTAGVCLMVNLNHK